MEQNSGWTSRGDAQRRRHTRSDDPRPPVACSPGRVKTPAGTVSVGDLRALSAARFLCAYRAALLAVVTHHCGAIDTHTVACLRQSNSRRSQPSWWGLTGPLWG
jgi:hypothetical protein